ncbi:MAG: PEP-CTERM sorting domain-containing protein [Azonexus sp.]
MSRNLIASALLAAGLLTTSAAQASFINVGGVVWDPDQVTDGFLNNTDFTANGTVTENAIDPANNIIDVTGWGKISYLNTNATNESAFCPGCELTYTFTMKLDSLTPSVGNFSTFLFKDLMVNVYVDNAKNYANTYATASDGLLWLALQGNGPLSGIGQNIGTGSDTGFGSALLDVIGGLAAGNFDTDTQLDGADMVFSSSFQPAVGNPGYLIGTVDLKGNSIPEPGSLALAGLGLLGLGIGRRRKFA